MLQQLKLELIECRSFPILYLYDYVMLVKYFFLKKTSVLLKVQVIKYMCL